MSALLDMVKVIICHEFSWGGGGDGGLVLIYRYIEAVYMGAKVHEILSIGFFNY